MVKKFQISYTYIWRIFTISLSILINSLELFTYFSIFVCAVYRVPKLYFTKPKVIYYCDAFHGWCVCVCVFFHRLMRRRWWWWWESLSRMMRKLQTTTREKKKMEKKKKRVFFSHEGKCFLFVLRATPCCCCVHTQVLHPSLWWIFTPIKTTSKKHTHTHTQRI